MKAVGYAVVVLAAFCAVCPAFAADGVLLPPSEAVKLTHQCSRENPGPVEASWAPDQAQIDALEVAFPEFFRKEARDWRGFLHMPNLADTDADKLLAKYIRQYAGFVIGGKKVIYVNAVTGWGISGEPGVWRTKAAMVCDGGSITFGVEFDPETKTFSHFSFNGVL